MLNMYRKNVFQRSNLAQRRKTVDMDPKFSIKREENKIPACDRLIKEKHLFSDLGKTLDDANVSL